MCPKNIIKITQVEKKKSGTLKQPEGEHKAPETKDHQNKMGKNRMHEQKHRLETKTER